MKTKITVIFFFIALSIYAQYNGNRFEVTANYIYTATSKLYLQPNSSDPIIRGTHENLDGIWSYSGEIGYRVYEDIVIGLGVEYIEKTFTNRNMNLGGIRAVMKDGYKVIPVTLTAYYTLPFSTEFFKFFMGGGGGLYFGKHIRHLGDITASTISNKVGYGIHVTVGMDYVFRKNFALRTQMRFRNPEFEMHNKYSSNVVNYDGRTFLLSTDTFDSKVDIDGISFVVGILFQL